MAASQEDSESNQTPDFEAALEELEALVTRMESGDLTLDESLQAFERGVKLARQCQSELKQAEQRIQVLTEEGDLTALDEDGNHA